MARTPRLSPPAPRHLAAIDLVRVACASAVLGYHYLFVFPMLPTAAPALFGGAPGLPRSLAGWSWWGWVGVELFFVISGYVIAASVGDATPRTFLRRRALRLFPAVWLCATLTAAALVAASSLPPGTVAARWLVSLALWPLGVPVDGAYWTIDVEIVFYGLVAWLIGRTRDRDRLLGRLGLGLAAWSAAFWTWRLLSPAAPDPTDHLVRLLLLPYGDCFALGIALHAASRDGLRARTTATLVLAGASVAAEIVDFTARVATTPGVTVHPGIPLALFALGSLAIAKAHRWTPPPSVARVTATLAAITYPLYLLNQVLGAALVVAAARAGLTGFAAPLVSAVIVVALATAVALYGEPQLRGRLARRVSPRRDPAPGTPPIASLPAG